MVKQILFITHSLYAGGAEKALIELLKAFDYRRYHVSLCLLYYEGEYLSDIPQEVEVLTLFEKKNSYYRKAFRYYRKHEFTWFLAFQMKRKIRKHYDTIVSFLEGYSLLFHSFIADKATKNISWVHCDLPNFHYTSDAFHTDERERACYEKMDDIVFVSQGALTNFDKLFPISVTKHCLYNVMDVDMINVLAHEYEVASDKFTVTTIGRLIDVKQFDAFIRVAKKFKDNGYSVRFQLIGGGDKERELLALRDELGLQEEVVLLGFMKNPYGYLRNSDLFVSTSITEGLPFVICEAFSLGVPVVATKTAGAIELLENGKCGILTNFDDCSIYEGIKSLIDNDVLLQKYQQKAKERAALFSVAQTMEKIYNLL